MGVVHHYTEEGAQKDCSKCNTQYTDLIDEKETRCGFIKYALCIYSVYIGDSHREYTHL